MRFPFEPPPAREFDAVGFGLNAVDYLVVVPHYPAYDTKVRLVEHERGAGGETASAMTSLRRLGMRTAYAGRFGSDDAGRFGDVGVTSDLEDAVKYLARASVDELENFSESK